MRRPGVEQVAERSAFAGGDLDYLRVEQYGDSSKLGARASLHERFSTAEVGWFAWLAALVDWPEAGEVADVGCGPGYLWAAGT